MHARTIAAIFKQLTSNNSVIGSKVNQQWIYTCQDLMHEMISGASLVLDDANIKAGDRVMYKGSNSKEWVAWNLATNARGAVFVPLYKEQTKSHVKHVLGDCLPKLFIDEDIGKNVSVNDNIGVISNTIEPSTRDYDICVNDVSNGLSTLIYTSGTSGSPKGVMLTNDNILSNIEAIHRRFIDHSNMKITTLNILPWAHIFGLTAELYYNILNDNTVTIAENKKTFVNDLREIRPDYIYVVPKVLSLIKTKVEKIEKLPFSSCIMPKVLSWVFGGNIRAIFVGGAKLDTETAFFYEKYGMRPCEGYGATETSPVVSVNHTDSPRNIQSVGNILDNVKVRIVNNEICVGGPTIMRGYWGNEEATMKALVKDNDTGEFWYKTGDSGRICENGFLFFEGRNSDNYKLSNGKFIDVHTVEGTVKKYVDGNFVVYGENMEHNILISDVQISDDTLSTINQDLESHMYIKKTILVTSEIFESHMTPKLSIKRKPLIQSLKDTNILI